MNFKLKVELVWEENPNAEISSSIYLTSDGEILIEGREVLNEQKDELMIPKNKYLISVDRKLVDAIKNML